MRLGYVIVAFLGINLHFGVAVKRYYATDSCGHVHGPDHLTVIEFDKDVDYIKNKPSTEQNLLPPVALRNTLWHCIIVIRGMPSANTRKYIGLEWRSFHIRDPDINTVEQSVESCGKAYVTIYKGSNTSAADKWTVCGKDTTRTFFEWRGDYVTLEFNVDFRRNDSYTTLPPPTTVKTCVTEEEAANAGTTSLPVCTTPRRRVRTTTPPDLYPYPEVYFRVDVTSFDYACNETVPDKVLKCNDSERCLDQSLVCDFYFSQNCKSSAFQEDKSDQTRDAPSYCFRKETTTTIPVTTPPPPPPPFPWEIVVASALAALGILALCWCCWRPGWFIWRCARLRNTMCCRTKHCICFRGPTRCSQCCAAEEQDDAEIHRTLGPGGVYNQGFVNGANIIPGPKAGQPGRKPSSDARRNSSVNRVNRKPSSMYVNDKYRTANGKLQTGSVPYNNGYGQDPNNFATDWLKFISGDGGHLREQR